MEPPLEATYSDPVRKTIDIGKTNLIASTTPSRDNAFELVDMLQLGSVHACFPK